MDSVYLQGSESVERASNNMARAAEQILRAANMIYESIQGLERVLENDRLERVRSFNEHGRH